MEDGQMKERLEGMSAFLSSALETVERLKGYPDLDYQEGVEHLSQLDDLIYSVSGDLHLIKRNTFFEEPLPPLRPPRPMVGVTLSLIDH
jgi:hypothetical protein